MANQTHWYTFDMKHIVLWAVFCFTLLHFAKDITQDILAISTPLDLLGNAHEDLSRLPQSAAVLFVFLGYVSFVLELFLLIAIPLFMLAHKVKLEKYIWLSTALLIGYFIVALLLDPRSAMFLAQ